MKSSQNLKEKQQYLYHEIIQAQYDPQQFQEFLQSEKGLDLDKWTMNQLIIAVKRFKKQPYQIKQIQENNKNNEIELSQNKSLDQSKQSLKQQKFKDKEVIISKENYRQSISSIQNNQIHNTSLYKYYVHTKKKPTQLWNQISKLTQQKQNRNGKNNQLIVSIKNTIKSSKNLILFKTSYVQYQITTQSKTIDWIVYRRFNQFKWLRQNLLKMYSNLPIPPIPSKTAIRSFNEKHIQERRIGFQKFLNKLLRIPELASDFIVEEFLKADHEQFKIAKKQYQSQISRKQNKCNQICSLFGLQQLIVDRPNVSPQTFDLYQNTMSLYQKLSYKAQQTSRNLFLLADNYSEMKVLIESLKIQQSTMKGCRFYDMVTQLFDQLKYETILHAKMLQVYVKENYSYQQKYIQQILIQIQNIKKKNDYFNLKYKDIFTKYQQGQLPNMALESAKKNNSAYYLRQYQRQKQQYRISLSNLLRQIDRDKNQTLLQHSNQWFHLYEKYIQGIRTSMLKGADILAAAMSMNQGKQLLEVEYIKK